MIQKSHEDWLGVHYSLQKEADTARRLTTNTQTPHEGKVFSRKPVPHGGLGVGSRVRIG